MASGTARLGITLPMIEKVLAREHFRPPCGACRRRDVYWNHPSAAVKSVVAQLEQDGKVTRGYLGVQIQPLTRELADSLGLSTAQGALVDSVQEGTPAAKAGLKAGDVIAAVNGETVASTRELSRKIADCKPGSTVELTYWRKGQEQLADVKLGSLPGEKTAP